MAEMAHLTQKIELGNGRQMMRKSFPIEALARELHDVVFTFGKPIPVWDELPPETRGWFMMRACRLVDDFLGEAE